MSRVEDAVTQDQVADSLVAPLDADYQPQSDQVPENWDSRLSIDENAIADSLMGVEPTQNRSQFRERAERHQEEQEEHEPFTEADAELEEEQFAAEHQEQQPQNAVPQELTPAEVQQGIQELGQIVENLGLNDPQFVQELAINLGAPPDEVNAPVLASTMSRMALSAITIAERGELVGPIHPLAAQQFTQDFCRAFGLDARTTPIDSQRFASTCLQGALSVVETAKALGLNAPISAINSPKMAEWFAMEIARCFGVNAYPDRAHAVRMADAGAKYVMNVMRRITSAQPQQRPAAARQSRPSNSRGSNRSSRGRGQRFASNRDIFTDDVMDRLAMNRL